MVETKFHDSMVKFAAWPRSRYDALCAEHPAIGSEHQSHECRAMQLRQAQRN